MIKKIFFFVIFIFLNTISGQELKIENTSVINALKNYENKSHIKFQENLYEESVNYIQEKSSQFVGNETGFFKLWSEVFNFFESDIKKKQKWKNRLEKYFRTTEYLSHINNFKNNYALTINTQRQELLGKLKYSTNNRLVFEHKNINSINVSDQHINNVVEKVNKLVLIEVIPEIIESLFVPLLISGIAMFFGVILGWKTKGVIFILGFSFAIWQSYKYSNELEKQIIENYKLNNSHLTVLPLLQKNTKEYFNNIVNQTNN